MQGVAGCRRVLQGVAECCRVLQGVAGCCRVLQCAHFDISACMYHGAMMPRPDTTHVCAYVLYFVAV